MDYPEFANFLMERAREKNLDAKRLSEMTGISAKSLEAIFSGDPNRLPSPPYLKGYLRRLGELLDFNPDEAWKQLEKLAVARSSGKADEMPRNRFSQKPVGKYFLAGAIAFFLILYLGTRFYQISGTPAITVLNPPENMYVSDANYISVSGRVSNSTELTINGEPVQAQSGGEWDKTVMLQPGINNIEITAKKFLGRETKVVRQVIYQSAQTGQPAGAGRPATSSTPGAVFQNQGF